MHNTLADVSDKINKTSGKHQSRLTQVNNYNMTRLLHYSNNSRGKCTMKLKQPKDVSHKHAWMRYA